MVYKIRPGSRIRAAAETVLSECERLERESRLTAQELVNESRPENAPLHDEFEWRDEVAGELWRVHQARNIINSIVTINEKQEPQRVFFNIEASEPEYYSINTILRSAEKTESLLNTALKEAEAFRRKYKTLKELAEVNQAIENVQRRHAAESAAVAPPM